MSRERILVGGAPGSGKTYNWLTIARILPKHTFHVIDPDDGVVRVWQAEFPGVKNINYYFTPTWFNKLSKADVGMTGGVREAFLDIKAKAKLDDWVVVEMLSNIWSMAQGGFVEQIFDKGVGEYFLEIRKGLEKGARRLDALKGWTDWQVINKMHNEDLMIPICYQLPCHVYATTTVSIQSSSGLKDEEAEIRSFYGDTNIRYEGQKHNPYRAQSLFLVRKGKEGWVINTFLKDRGRKWLENEPMFDFGLQYIVGVANFPVE